MLKVNEVFGPTIQGEGASAGLDVFFLRLSNCNLHCVWCDTPYTWNWIGTKHEHEGGVKYDPEAETHEWETRKLVEVFRMKAETHGIKSLVISGGEPLIQQKQLVEFCQALKEDDWWIEVETNGTVPPKPELVAVVDQFNVSPKLSNSGDPLKLRIRERALEALASNPKATFKFVVSRDEDISEISELVETFGLERVYLMPLGKTAKELEETRNLTQALAERYGFTFSDRLHVTLLGGGRGI